jgi:hypothetical protein
MARVTFDDDIMPVLKQYLGPMAWRFDLTSYEEVKASAALIYSRISSADAPMPPPPFPRLPQAFIEQFKAWMDDGYPQS